MSEKMDDIGDSIDNSLKKLNMYSIELALLDFTKYDSDT